MGIRDLPRGTTIYATEKHVSRSGIYHVVGLSYVEDGRIVDVYGDEFNYKYVTKHGGGFETNGAGLDVGYAMVNALGYQHHNDGDWFKHESR